MVTSEVEREFVQKRIALFVRVVLGGTWWLTADWQMSPSRLGLIELLPMLAHAQTALGERSVVLPARRPTPHGVETPS